MPFAADHALVTGIRVNRQDSFVKNASSRIANAIRRSFTHDGATDTGCPLKVIQADVARRIPFFKGMHRFLPALVQLDGGTVKEVPVRHFPRVAGQSKYHLWNRLLGPAEDLLAFRWMREPLHPLPDREQGMTVGHVLVFGVGMVGQVLFAARMFVQWFHSEKAGRPLSPVLFWQLSLLGRIVFFAYGLLRKDFAIVLGQLLTYFIYIRNLHLKRQWLTVTPLFRWVVYLVPVASLAYLLSSAPGNLADILGNAAIPPGSRSGAPSGSSSSPPASWCSGSTPRRGTSRSSPPRSGSSAWWAPRWWSSTPSSGAIRCSSSARPAASSSTSGTCAGARAGPRRVARPAGTPAAAPPRARDGHLRREQRRARGQHHGGAQPHHRARDAREGQLAGPDDERRAAAGEAAAAHLGRRRRDAGLRPGRPRPAAAPLGARRAPPARSSCCKLTEELTDDALAPFLAAGTAATSSTCSSWRGTSAGTCSATRSCWARFGSSTAG